MKTMLALILLGTTAVQYGCNQPLDHHDDIPPASPRNVYTETGDNFIEIFWNSNIESDLAGYNVFVSNSYYGRYELIGSTNRPYFLDGGAHNGVTYYYAITAYDFDGNESDLSRDVAYDIPRPEGYDVAVLSMQVAPDIAGYDFSRYGVVSYTDRYTDMFAETIDGQLYMTVRTDTDIQNMGPTGSILDIRRAPSSGWAPGGKVRLLPEHTYVVWTWDDHYAKFRVRTVSQGRVVFDWAYQLQPSNPLLKKSVRGERR